MGAVRVLPADPGFFSALARAGSLSAAGRELGISTPAVSSTWRRWNSAWACSW